MAMKKAECIISLLLLSAKAFSGVPDTVNIENPNVHSYITENVYENTKQATVIKKYLNGLDEKRLDQPNLVRVTLPSPASSKGKFYYSTSKDFSNAVVVDIKKGDTECIIMNPVPQTTVYSKAVIGSKKVVSGKTFIDGQVRMIYLPSVLNVRDMGGWEAQSGKRIKYGLLFRGGELDFQEKHTATPEDIAEMRRIGILADLDLRDYDESYQTSSALGSDIPYIFNGHTIFDYKAMKEDAAKWKSDFEFIVDNLRNGRGVYLHCIMGADRTGLICFMIGGLLGMPIDQLLKDYELTSMTASNYYRDLSRLNLHLQYINQKQGSTLIDRFYNYFRYDLQVKDKYIRDFRKIMLDGYEAYVATTDIDDVEADDEVIGDDVIYDLSGRAIEKPSTGFYIQNGKKHIAK